MESKYREIGNNIRQIRKQEGLTQAELGKRIGRAESSITKYEKGTVEIPLKIIERIASELNVPLEVIFPPKADYENYKTVEKSLEEYLYSLGYDFRGIPASINGDTWFLSYDDEDNSLWRDFREENIITYAVPYKIKAEAFQTIEAFVHFTLQQLAKNSSDFSLDEYNGE